MVQSKRYETVYSIVPVTAVVLGIYFSGNYAYVLFHGLVEVVSIAIAFAIFTLVWNTRTYHANNYLRLLGIGYAFSALIDLFHTFAFQGMTVFTGYGANLAPQLWLAARYLQTVTLVAAPLVIQRNLDNRLVFGGYAMTAAVLLTLVYSGHFPDCIVVGQGLTPFKKDSEYVISVLLVVSLYFLSRNRDHFSSRIYWLLVASISCTIISELCFTAFVSMYDFSNKLGHIAKLVAFYLVYRAVLVTGLKEPFEVVFRTLKQTEQELRDHQETLEDRIRERTASLEKEVAERIQAEAALHRLNRELRAISDCNQALMKAEDEQTLLNDVCRIICGEAGYRMAWVGWPEQDEAKTVRPVAWAGVEDGYLTEARLTWADTERGRGPAGTAIREGRSAWIQEFASDPHAAPWRENALQRGYRSVISLPLKNEKVEPFGVLVIYSPEANAFTPDEVRLLEELAGDLAFGIQALRNRNELKRAAQVAQARIRMLDAAYVAGITLDDSLRLMLDEIEAQVGSHIAFYHFLEEDQQTLALQSWSTHTLAAMCTAEGKGSHYPVAAAGVWADCVRERRPVIHNDYNSLPHRKGMPEGHAPVIRELVVPVFRGDRLVAIVGVGNKPEDYNESDVQAVSLLGDFSWEIVKRKRVEESLRTLNEELEQRVKVRTAELAGMNAELERMNKLFIGRELKMVELKERIRQLEKITAEWKGA